MKKLFIILATVFFANIGSGGEMSLVKQYATEVPVDKLNQEVAAYLKNEISYIDSFKSDYVLVEYKDTKSGKTWYIVDGYFTLQDNSILFLDFDYDPSTKMSKAINNYVFVPEENKRYLLKADEACNPFKRHFIGVIVVGFKEAGHLDELISFLGRTLNGSAMLYTDGANHMIQDLTSSLGTKPLFTLHEKELVQKLNSLSYVKGAMIIPSGRNPSDEVISQAYEPITPGCKQ